MPVTISVIKADVGGLVGHTNMHPDLIDAAGEFLDAAVEAGTLHDHTVMAVGDDLELILTHGHGEESPDIHRLAWDCFVQCAEVADKLGLYGVGQDLREKTFAGNVTGLGPGSAEIELEDRASEPLLVFMADKTDAGCWNLPLFKMFGDPFNTPGLVIDPKMNKGYSYEVLDLHLDRVADIRLPEELYDLLALIGSVEHYGIRRVRRNTDNAVAACTSASKVFQLKGKSVGKDDPVMIVRAQSGYPSVGELTEPFAHPHMVAGWMRGSHWGPLMPVPFHQTGMNRFDGPPKVVCAGFQVTAGKLHGPVDIFDDPAFDGARREAIEIADYLRKMGPFEPHRFSEGGMEYTSMPHVLQKLEGRFRPASNPVAVEAK
ncbi:MAG TPA: fructose-1,6-bisphosphatase [bacterium]|nr:fructose-1,6-bisphosphatase [bacterium]